LELLAVMVVLAILAVLALPRSAGNSLASRRSACYALKANVEVQAQLWFRHKAVWPAADLSDLAADPLYLPEGLPVCPVDGSAYTFDPATQRVVGHVH
jgi:type II secretory pathway pseudopilin PulG